MRDVKRDPLLEAQIDVEQQLARFEKDSKAHRRQFTDLNHQRKTEAHHRDVLWRGKRHTRLDLRRERIDNGRSP
jgi:hypothetical protein